MLAGKMSTIEGSIIEHLSLQNASPALTPLVVRQRSCDWYSAPKSDADLWGYRFRDLVTAQAVTLPLSFKKRPRVGPGSRATALILHTGIPNNCIRSRCPDENEVFGCQHECPRVWSKYSCTVRPAGSSRGNKQYGRQLTVAPGARTGGGIQNDV
jgi:hypothetical protein